MRDRESVVELLLKLREMGVTDHGVLSAFERTPRQVFVPVVHLDEAYQLGRFPIECGQIMTSVEEVARAVHALDIQPGNKVLELGTGTGYQTAILAGLAGKVISLERFKTLWDKANARLATLKIINAQLLCADGSNGLIEKAHYDRIISNCSFEQTPRGFLEQLTQGGILVAPVGPGDDRQMMRKMTKIGARFEVEDLFEVRFQPFINGVAKAI